MHWAPSFLPSHSILSSPFRGQVFSPAKKFGGFLCIGTFSVCWQLQLINLSLSSIALSNYIHVHPNLAYYSQSTPVPLEYQLPIWLEGPGAYRAGNPYAWAPLDVKKIVLIFTVKYMLKFENFWKCTPEMYLFRFLNMPLGGGGGGNTDVCPGRQIPSRRHCIPEAKIHRKPCNNERSATRKRSHSNLSDISDNELLTQEAKDEIEKAQSRSSTSCHSRVQANSYVIFTYMPSIQSAGHQWSCSQSHGSTAWTTAWCCHIVILCYWWNKWMKVNMMHTLKSEVWIIINKI